MISSPARDFCGSGTQYIDKVENLRGNSDYSEKHAGKPVFPLAVFLPVGIQASREVETDFAVEAGSLEARRHRSKFAFP
jgi:hypothetical protein